MTSYLHDLIGFVSLHAEFAYGAIFLAAFLEAIPILGALIPGSTIIVALSALVPGGDLKLAPVLAAAVVGALLGDGAAFAIGRRNEQKVLTSWPLSGYPGLVAQAEAFFTRYGTLAVLFARFVPPVRSACRRNASIRSTSPRFCYGHLRISCPAYWPARRRNNGA